jgi:hypothetical protein
VLNKEAVDADWEKVSELCRNVVAAYERLKEQAIAFLENSGGEE